MIRSQRLRGERTSNQPNTCACARSGQARRLTSFFSFFFLIIIMFWGGLAEFEECGREDCLQLTISQPTAKTTTTLSALVASNPGSVTQIHPMYYYYYKVLG